MGAKQACSRDHDGFSGDENGCSMKGNIISHPWRAGRGVKAGDPSKEEPETGPQAQTNTLDRESNIIPFEHAILDTALTAVTRRLRAATDKLDSHRQIVDQLTCNVDRETLVSVRMLKNEQQELLDRVSVVLECLEHTAGTYADLLALMRLLLVVQKTQMPWLHT